jgi:hypothetical protein
MTARICRQALRFSAAAIFLAAALSLPFPLAAGDPRTPQPVPQEPSEKPSLPVFEFRSGFWINLHHFLYQQAHARKSPREANAGAPFSTAALTAEEIRAWSAALNYYLSGFADRDLLFNGDMVLINDRLAEMETCADLSGRSAEACTSGLRPELIAALESAASVYRARWWPQHDRANRDWIAAVSPLVRQHGVRIAEQLADIYQSRWPAGPLRVDVVSYAGPYGAYTTLEPSHLTISSLDPANQGVVALEVVFHEASHVVAQAVRDAIVKECRRLGKPIPRDLWHALLFYTTGEIVRRTLRPAPGGTSADPYKPYAYRNGLYARGWTSYEHALEIYWQPYLEGRVEYATAVTRMVNAL